jgi:CDGSH-type Zn-finger protein/ferredoxin
MNKLSIKPIKNGPLKIINLTNQNLENILFYKNEPMELKNNTLLCRCGKSNKQPYCDGNHIKVGFSSQNSLEDELIQVYKTKGITINFNRSICSGSGNCVSKFPTIYSMGSQNWIHPNLGTKEEIIESIKNCPSGALSYSFDETNPNNCDFEDCQDEKIEILEKGPIEVRGSIDIEVDKWATNANKTKFVLCRCGNSLNKPFCDYSHASIEDKNWI